MKPYDAAFKVNLKITIAFKTFFYSGGFPLSTAQHGPDARSLGVQVNKIAVMRVTVDQLRDLHRSAINQVNDRDISVGAHVTNICVHDRGLTRFVRILPSGGRDVTLAPRPLTAARPPRERSLVRHHLLPSSG